MLVKRSVDGLKKNAQKKRQESFDKVEKGIQQLIKEKRAINFNTVAEASGVSKAWLYKEAEVRQRIEHLRSQVGSQGKTPSKFRASEQSLKAIIQKQQAQIRRLEAENQELRKQNEVAYGHVIRARELERQVVRLEKENKQLSEKPNPAPLATAIDVDGSLDSLRKLGVEMNSTLERLISETPGVIVASAIESLREAMATERVQNPGGFLNKAITDAWKPNKKEVEDISERKTFKRWYDLAHAQRIVSGAQRIDGVQYVITPDGQYVPFEEMVAQTPLAVLEN